MDTSALAAFLVEAKKNTYASGSGKAASSRKASHDLSYRSGDFAYLDSYFGGVAFGGEEAVYFKDDPVWTMNYYGKTLIPNVPQGFIETLKAALMQVQPAAPYRGPAELRNGQFLYTCTSNGGLDFFHGVEAISHAGKEIYRLYFHGGLVVA